MTNHEASHDAGRAAELAGSDALAANGGLNRLGPLEPRSRATTTEISTATGRRAVLIGHQPNPEPSDLLNGIVIWEEGTEIRPSRRIIVVEGVAREPMDLSSEKDWFDAALEAGGIEQAAANYADHVGVTITGTLPMVEGTEPSDADEHLVNLITGLANREDMAPLLLVSEPRRAAIEGAIRDKIERQGRIDLQPFDMTEGTFEHNGNRISFSSFERDRSDHYRPVTFVGLLSPHLDGCAPADQDELIETFADNPDMLAATDIVSVSGVSSQGDIEAAAAFVGEYVLANGHPDRPIILAEAANQVGRVLNLTSTLRNHGLPVTAVALLDKVYTPDPHPQVEIPLDTRIFNAREILGELFHRQSDTLVLFGRLVSEEPAGSNPEVYSQLTSSTSLGETEHETLMGGIARLATSARN